MNFRGLSEPLVGRVCSARALERHVGSGFLGPIRIDEPLIELIGVALSDDEKSLMVHVHAATETKKFISTAHVTVVWYERQMETSSLLRGCPQDARALDVLPCLFFESGDRARQQRPTIPELVAADAYGFARDLASSWLRGKRPVRRTEQFFITMLGADDDEAKALAQAGLGLLVTALARRVIAPSLKREIGGIVMAIARRLYKPSVETDPSPDDSP